MLTIEYKLWARREYSGRHKAKMWMLFCSQSTDNHEQSFRVLVATTLDHLMQYARAEWPGIDVQVQPNKEEYYE